MADLRGIAPALAARELALRRRMRSDVVEFARAVPVPGRPLTDDEDSAFAPVESVLAAHHVLLLQTLQRISATPHGRLMVFMPPGSAKSSYASVVFPAWYLGTGKDRRVILASYGDDLARKHGRRTRQLLRDPRVVATVNAEIRSDSSAAQEFGLTNGGEYMAAGILSGITGNRAHGIVIDDPIKGRAEADSETLRERTFQAYEDDVLTRLIPGGWVCIVQTRWHEDDLAGRLLPLSWAGESGAIKCRDGNTWEVLCLQARCAVQPDPVGRATGEYLWPQWFDAAHWAQFEGNKRTWSALYQQVPSPADGTLFRKADMGTYDKRPDVLRIFGASDYAVTTDGGDWTEHGVFGLDAANTLYVLAWWRGQTAPDVWIDAFCDLVNDWKPLAWFGEAGPIRRSIEPFLRKRMIERNALCRIEWLASVQDKETRAQAVIAMAGMGRVLWPERAPWLADVQRQCLAFPAGRHDDAVDVLGLIGRGMAFVGRAAPVKQPEPEPEYHGAGGWMS